MILYLLQHLFSTGTLMVRFHGLSTVSVHIFMKVDPQVIVEKKDNKNKMHILCVCFYRLMY